MEADFGNAVRSESPKRILAVKPIDQMQSEYISPSLSDASIVANARAMFSVRMAFENFNPEYFVTLSAALAKAHYIAPDDEFLSYALAHVLVQYRPSYPTLQRAKSLLDSLGHLQDARLQADLKRLRGLANVLLAQCSNGPPPPRPVPHRVNWAIYNRCPMICRGCYNNFSPQQLSLAQAQQVVDSLRQAGVGAVILSGGDPLLWPEVWDLLDYLNSCGMQVGIDTTGYTLDAAMLKQLKPLVRYIGLPLDGSCDAAQRVFRKASESVFEHTLQALNLCKTYAVPVKVNTLIHGQNIHDLDAIGRLVSAYPCVRHWSIFQWWPLRSTEALRDLLAVDLEVFKSLTGDLHTRFPHLNLRVRSVQSRALTHFFIQNSGVVTTFGSYYQEEIILGHILRHSVADILRSPAIRYDSPKLKVVNRFEP